MHTPRTLQELVNEQVGRAEAARKTPLGGTDVPVPLVVTVSREMGSGAQLIARQLAEDLGWSLWGQELLDAMAESGKVGLDVVEAFDEKHVGQVERLFHSVFGVSDMAEFSYARQLYRAVVGIARLGNAVILGRGANFMLPDALTVRITASMEHRVENMMRFEHLGHDEAVAKLRRSDGERRQFLITLFGKKTVESSVYDLQINLDHLDLRSATEMVKAAVHGHVRVLAERHPDGVGVAMVPPKP
jgi:cytidylate kinase